MLKHDIREPGEQYHQWNSPRFDKLELIENDGTWQRYSATANGLSYQVRAIAVRDTFLINPSSTEPMSSTVVWIYKPTDIACAPRSVT